MNLWRSRCQMTGLGILSSKIHCKFPMTALSSQRSLQYWRPRPARDGPPGVVRLGRYPAKSRDSLLWTAHELAAQRHGRLRWSTSPPGEYRRAPSFNPVIEGDKGKRRVLRSGFRCQCPLGRWSREIPPKEPPRSIFALELTSPDPLPPTRRPNHASSLQAQAATSSRTTAREVLQAHQVIGLSRTTSRSPRRTRIRSASCSYRTCRGNSPNSRACSRVSSMGLSRDRASARPIARPSPCIEPALQ